MRVSDRRFAIGDNWPLLVFAALLVIDIALKGRFTPFDARSLAVNALPLALVSLGQFLVALTRGIDLSLGPIASVAGAIMAITVTDHPEIGLTLPLLVGLAAGLINGFFVARLGVPPIIVTLATMSVWQGVAVLVLPDPGGAVPQAYQAALIGGFSEPLRGIAAELLCVLFGTWLLSTRYGLHLRAVGGDEQAARMSGVRIANVKFIAYALAGVLAALGGMYLGVATLSGSPTTGDSYILTSIAAVVIGAVPLSGGRGTALGVVSGALILTITGSLLYFAEISSFYQSVINGAILLAVVGSGGTRDWLRAIAAPRRAVA